MIYAVNEVQLLRVWSIIRCFADLREIEEQECRSEILTNAQILLTAFVLDLEPLADQQTGSAQARPECNRMVAFDA